MKGASGLNVQRNVLTSQMKFGRMGYASRKPSMKSLFNLS